LLRVFSLQNRLLEPSGTHAARRNLKSGLVGKGKRMIGLLYAIAMIFFVLWVVGFLFAHVGGGLIHILLVLAVIVVVYNLLTGRRAV
jgi:hypothetical protein